MHIYVFWVYLLCICMYFDAFLGTLGNPGGTLGWGTLGDPGGNLIFSQVRRLSTKSSLQEFTMEAAGAARAAESGEVVANPLPHAPGARMT